MQGSGLWVVGAGSVLVGWVAGLAMQMQSSAVASPMVAMYCAGAACAGLVGASAVRRRGAPGWLANPALVVFLTAFGAAAAYAWADLQSGHRMRARLPHALEGRLLQVEGTVLELPRRSARGVQFVLGVEQARDMGSGTPVQGVPSRIWLGWWQEGHVDALVAAPVPHPRPGERWSLPVTLRRPHGTFNPHAFDAERWFLEQDLGAAGQVPAAHRAKARRLGWARGYPLWPEVWRAALRDHIDRHVPDPRLAGLVAGLTIGDQSAVDQEDWALFRDTGTAHALSISGLHITAFAALAAPLAAWLWRRWPRGCLIWPAPLVGAWVGLACAATYALLAGWGLPAQRTVAMLAVVTAVRSLALQWPPMVVWCAAAAPVLVLDPWAVGQAGFWLSFAAVGLLMLSGSSRSTRAPQALHQRAAAALHTQAVTSIGLAPLAAVCFQQVSVIGVLANLVAVPWITVVLTPLCMAGLVVPAIWNLLPWAVDPLRALLQTMSQPAWAVFTVPASSPIWLALAMLGAVLALRDLPLRLRLCGIVLMLPLLWPAPQRLPEGRFDAWGLDIGQGSAVLVRTRHHALLMDAGPLWSESADAGSRIVVPVLRGLGVRALDLFVVTHRDADHVGGAASVVRGLPVARLLASLEPQHPLWRMGVSGQRCQAGQSWRWDGVHFRVLHPVGEASPRAKPNSISCVLRVEDAAGRSLLITGDIEAEQESALVALEGAAGLRSTALVVPHHGSRTSSTAAFLDAVQPSWALAQTGHRNRHGHPAPDVMLRYAERGIPVENTAWCGAWHWADGAPTCWRNRARRHWHDAPP